MVNGALTAPAAAGSYGFHAVRAFPIIGRKPHLSAMPKSKPLSETQTSDHGRASIASAVRTLEAEAGGITALSAAIHDGLGRAFVAAVDLIHGARGRVIVTGMGKSGHVGRKIAATFASTGTPAFFVPP